MRGTFALALVMAVSCHPRKGSDRDAGIDPIDKVYARYKAEHTWVDPVDDTPLQVEPQREGSFATCAHCDYPICYEDLPIEHRLKIESDADLVRMVRWLRDPDACVRRVAEHLLWPKLGLPGDAMSISVQDREDVPYHSLACALKARLDAKKVAYDPTLFDGLVVSIAAADFAPMFHGTWREEDGTTVEVGEGTLRVQSANWKWSNKFDEVRVNSKYQFEIMAHSPDREYLFWPLTKDVAWVAYSNQGRHLDDGTTSGGDYVGWTKIKRSP